MIKKLVKIGKRRMIGMLIGNTLLGVGVCIFRNSGMGNDPFSAMILSVSAQLKMPFSSFLILLNLFIFIIEAVFGRKFIGLGTMVNWFLVGYAAEFFMWLFKMNFTPPEAFIGKLTFVIVGVLITSLGVSLYQTSDAGIAPYDSVSLIMADRSPLPYFWCRIICDATSAVVCLLTGGLIGLGTFICAFGLGPIVHFINEHYSKRIIYQQNAAR